MQSKLVLLLTVYCSFSGLQNQGEKILNIKGRRKYFFWYIKGSRKHSFWLFQWFSSQVHLTERILREMRASEIMQYYSMETEELNEDILFDLREWIINHNLSRGKFMDSFCLLGAYEILLQACFLANQPFLHRIETDLTLLIIKDLREKLDFECSLFSQRNKHTMPANFFQKMLFESPLKPNWDWLQ